MKTTGRYCAISEAEENPSEPFIKDLKTDLEKINKYFNNKTSLKIKKELIELILNDIQ